MAKQGQRRFVPNDRKGPDRKIRPRRTQWHGHPDCWPDEQPIRSGHDAEGRTWAYARGFRWGLAGYPEASVPGWAWTPYGTPDGWRAFWRGYRYPIAAAPAAGPHWKITNIDERM